MAQSKWWPWYITNRPGLVIYAVAGVALSSLRFYSISKAADHNHGKIGPLAKAEITFGVLVKLLALAGALGKSKKMLVAFLFLCLVYVALFIGEIVTAAMKPDTFASLIYKGAEYGYDAFWLTINVWAIEATINLYFWLVGLAFMNELEIEYGNIKGQ